MFMDDLKIKGAESVVRSTPKYEADYKRRESEVRAASDLLTRQQTLYCFGNEQK